jgi:hypothetical protein
VAKASDSAGREIAPVQAVEQVHDGVGDGQLLPAPSWRSTSRRSLLPRSGIVDRVLLFTVLSATQGACIFLLRGHFVAGLFVSLAPALYGLVPFSIRAAQRWAARRQFERLPLQQPREARTGERVRFAGKICARAILLSTLQGHPAVVSRYLGARGQSDRRWLQRPQFELHACEFELEVEEGLRVLVDVGHLQLVPHPPEIGPEIQRGPLLENRSKLPLSPCVWIYREETIRPDERVELVGTFTQLPDAQVSAASDRGTRLRPALVGHPDAPVLIRRV